MSYDIRRVKRQYVTGPKKEGFFISVMRQNWTQTIRADREDSRTGWKLKWQGKGIQLYCVHGIEIRACFVEVQ